MSEAEKDEAPKLIGLFGKEGGELWTIHELIADLKMGIVRSGTPFDEAVVQALELAAPMLGHAQVSGWTDMSEPPIAEVARLRALLHRIAEGAAWVKMPASAQHSISEALIVGTVEQFGKGGPVYGNALGDRTGAMDSPEAARKNVLGEVIGGAMTAARRALYARIAKRKAEGTSLIFIDQNWDGEFLGGLAGSTGRPDHFKALERLGIKWASAGDHSLGMRFDGCVDVPAELPSWLRIEPKESTR